MEEMEKIMIINGILTNVCLQSREDVNYYQIDALFITG